jgi:hypothetical protein
VVTFFIIYHGTKCSYLSMTTKRTVQDVTTPLLLVPRIRISGSGSLLPTIYAFMTWTGKTFPFIIFDHLVNSIYLYQSFLASAFRVKNPVKTGISLLHDDARPNNACLMGGGGSSEL